MRRAGEEYLASYDGFSSIEASAESTTLGDSSIDFVTAGQAFSLVRTECVRSEFIRILKPAGCVRHRVERQTDGGDEPHS